MRIYPLLIVTLLFVACNPAGTDGTAKDTTVGASSQTEIDEVRPNPKTTPVAAYEKRTLNDLNEWYFRVKLFETKQRFVYKLTMQYEEVNEEKEIGFPNLKMEPQPQIKKGAKDYEAIVGFLDNKGVFKEYLLISAEGGQLRLKTLKYYAVSSK
jgi:hypothetical protein